MILGLEKLRKNFKLYRKKDHEIAARLDLLLSYSKFEIKYDGDIHEEEKKKFITAFLTSMEVRDRKIQREKKIIQREALIACES